MSNYVPLFLATIFYFFLHSWLASPGFKSKLIPPLRPLTFRLIYNFVALILLALLLLLYKYTPGEKIFDSQWLTWIGFILMAVSIALMYLAFRGYSLGEFLGTHGEYSSGLNTSSLNAYVRHPLYFATIILLLGWLLWLPYFKTLGVVIIAFIYILLGAKIEENKLEKLYGQDYKNYQKKVPFLWPKIVIKPRDH